MATMHALFWTLLVVAAYLSVLLFYARWSSRQRRLEFHTALPCRSAGLPLGIDIVFTIYKNAVGRRSLEAAASTYEIYGNTFQQSFMGGRFINTVDSENIKAITSSCFADYGMGSRRRAASIPLLGPGIFNNDGEAWRRSRRLFRPAFVTKLLQDPENIFESHIQNLLAVIPRNGCTVDLSELFLRFTMDVSAQHFFGQSASTLLEHHTSSAQAFNQAFTAAQKPIPTNYILGRFSRFRPDAKFRKARMIVWDFVDKYVSQAPLMNKGALFRGTVQEYMVRSSEDPIELRFELLHLLLAARDTTASLLDSLWLVISRRSDVWEAIMPEVRALKGGKPTAEQLKGCTYLQACILEALRLWPPVPINTRECIRPTFLPTGGGPHREQSVELSAGTIVVWNTFVLHRRVDLWGSDAAEFKPERWFTGDGIKRPGWEYLPFSGGPRRCLGSEFAILEASYVTARLMQEFSKGVESADSRPWKENITLTCCNFHGTKIRVLQ